MLSKPLPARPVLEALLKSAKAWWDIASPEQRREMHAAQRKSWVIGETMLAHPGMSRAAAEALYEHVVMQGTS